MRVAACWRVTQVDKTQPAVQINIRMNPNATYKSIAVAPKYEAAYHNDAAFRKMADAAMHDLQTCKLQAALPPEKYAQWAEIEMIFDPQMSYDESQLLEGFVDTRPDIISSQSSDNLVKPAPSSLNENNIFIEQTH